MEAKDIGEPSKRIKRTDNAITVINYLLKKKRARIEELSRRVEIGESQRIFIGEETELIKNVELLVSNFKNNLSQVIGKLPPQALELETTVLGGAILERPAFEVVRKFLLPEHFYLETNREVFKALLRLGDKSTDMNSLVVELRRTGHLEVVGGAYYIAELTSKVCSTATIEYHARILIEMAIKRQLITLTGGILHECFDDGADCFNVLEELENGINEIKGWIK
jgi:replicative DNA helicase